MKCAICNKEFKSITQTHLKKHSITPKKYKEQYPETELFSNDTKMAMSKNISRAKKGKPNLKAKGRKFSEEHKENIKKNHWSKKSKEETVAIRAKQSENGYKVMELLHNEGRAHRYTSETAKAVWTDKHREYLKNKITGLKRTEETKEKIRINHWSKKSKEEVDVIIERIFLKDAQLKETEKGWFWSEKSKHEMFYMSSYEYRRLMFLEANPEVEWFSTKHNIRISYDWGNSIHTYIPDILIKMRNGSEIVEEIKGYIREPLKFEAKNKAADIWCKTKNKQYNILFEKDLENV